MKSEKERIMITEIIKFKLTESTTDERFMEEVVNFSQFFQTTFDGFIDLEFTQGDEGWIIVIHWRSMEDVKACGEVLQSNPEELAGYSSLVDKESMNLTFLEQKYVTK
jgi:heme-degrading monooxygenase HmoA